jgi:hypothetical protein
MILYGLIGSCLIDYILKRSVYSQQIAREYGADGERIALSTALISWTLCEYLYNIKKNSEISRIMAVIAFFATLLFGLGVALFHLIEVREQQTLLGVIFLSIFAVVAPLLGLSFGRTIKGKLPKREKKAELQSAVSDSPRILPEADRSSSRS